jgi:hypothetical protein
MILFACPICKKALKSPDHGAGKKTHCPRCSQRLRVPTDNIPEVVPASLEDIPEALPARLDDDRNPLTACPACGRAIAKEAMNCPGCGAPNNWLQPEIVRFFNSIHRFDFPTSIQFNYEKYVLTGVDPGSNQMAREFSDFANSIGVIAPLNLHGLATIAGVHFGGKAIEERAQKKLKAFRIDFTYSPPAWSSTDDSYWYDVMDFFRLP